VHAMNRRGMDGWMGRGREREREMYFIVFFSNSLAGERKGWSTQSLRVGRKKGERGKKRERKKRKKRKSGERASGMDENREASALRRGYIYGERLDARLLSVRFFCFVFAFVCLVLLARALFRFIFFLPQDTSHDDDDDNADATIISRVVSLHSHPGRGPTSPPRVSFGTFKQNIIR